MGGVAVWQRTTELYWITGSSAAGIIVELEGEEIGSTNWEGVTTRTGQRCLVFMHFFKTWTLVGDVVGPLMWHSCMLREIC
jgi:hypothetical protein